MPSNVVNHVVYDAWNCFNRDTWVGAWIKRWVHWDGRGAVLRKCSAPWRYRPFLRCTVECRYVVCIAGTVACFVNISSTCLPTASLDFVALDKPFD